MRWSPRRRARAIPGARLAADGREQRRAGDVGVLDVVEAAVHRSPRCWRPYPSAAFSIMVWCPAHRDVRAWRIRIVLRGDGTAPSGRRSAWPLDALRREHLEVAPPAKTLATSSVAVHGIPELRSFALGWRFTYAFRSPKSVCAGFRSSVIAVGLVWLHFASASRDDNVGVARLQMLVHGVDVGDLWNSSVSGS
jgi:hypothetical protein